jgi:hypothetical protein
VLIWAVIFLGGKHEWEYNVPTDCGVGCQECSSGGGFFGTPAGGCAFCAPGWINGGLQCFADPSALPPVSTAAGLGGGFYFTIIVMAQVAGASFQIVLMLRLHRRRLLSRRERIILLTALAIEVVRMLTVDLFMLRDYFSGMEFQVYRVPDNASASNSSAPLYYIARVGGHEYDAGRCSTFSSDSPLLDYGRSSGFATGGHPRFAHLGWVLGGEFAMYYFAATVINEVADNFFVIPADTTRYGWRCKAFAVVLEVFQLGALFPAAAFEHADCLKYMNPLNVPLEIIRNTIIAFGYAIWGSLVIIGILSLFGVCLHVMILGCLHATNHACPAGGLRDVWMKIVGGPCTRIHERMFDDESGEGCGPCCNIFVLYLSIASVPMCIAGSVLGFLVILGQGSKEEPQKVLAATLLLLDVLFKLVVTVCCDCVERARRARSQGRQPSSPSGISIRPDSPAHGPDDDTVSAPDHAAFVSSSRAVGGGPPPPPSEGQRSTPQPPGSAAF